MKSFRAANCSLLGLCIERPNSKRGAPNDVANSYLQQKLEGNAGQAFICRSNGSHS
jgi:hypothetical protein